MEKIPKIIHGCWFGMGEMPELTKYCIKSWEEQLPEYKIIIWNENNFDLESNLFVKQAYNAKKYAFVADYVRLFVLYHYGGIYMDTDVEVIKNLDKFLIYPSFSGFESSKWIPTGIIGSEKNHPWISRLLKYYDDRPFINKKGKPDLTTNVKIISKISEEEYGWKRNGEFQILKNEVNIFPSDYFCPMKWNSKKLSLTENTHTIHHFAGSWK